MQWAVKRSIPVLKRDACYGLSGRVSDAFWSVAGVDSGSGGPHGVVGSPAPCLPRSAILPCWSHKGVLVPAMLVPPPSPPFPVPSKRVFFLPPLSAAVQIIRWRLETRHFRCQRAFDAHTPASGACVASITALPSAVFTRRRLTVSRVLTTSSVPRIAKIWSSRASSSQPAAV